MSLPTFQRTILGRNVLATASIDQIAKTFAEETQDLPQIHSLILAHSHFVSSEMLLGAFVNEYPDHVTRFKSLQDDASRIRVLNFIKKWIDFQRPKFEDPDSALRKTLDDWIDHLEQEKSPLLGFAKGLMAKKYEAEDDDSEELPSIIKKRKNGSDLSVLVCFDPREIARQLTLIGATLIAFFADYLEDYSYLKGIDKEEMLKSRWLEVKTSPTLSRASERGNHLAHWFAQQFLLAKTRNKVKYLTQFLRICECLLELQNFQSLMSIYLGLNLPCMSHFTPIWKGLPSKAAAIWKKVNSVLDYRQNFAAYRDYVKDLTAPLIPCQEVLLKDLLYHNEGTDDFIAEGIIDMQKLDVMGRMIEDFRKFQESPPKFEKFNNLYEFLEKIPTDITLAKLDEMAGVIRTTEGQTESDSASMSGFMGESTSETEGTGASRADRKHGRTGTLSNPTTVASKLGPSFRDRRTQSVNDGIGKSSISEGMSRVTGK